MTDSQPTPTHIVLAVVLRDGQVCVALRSARVATGRGLWSVVTGYLEPGAAPLDQAWQELEEELGFCPPEIRLTRTLPPLVLTSEASSKQFVVHAFLFDVDHGCEVVLNWEHSEAAWVSPERLADPDCVQWQRGIVMALLEQRPG